METLKTIWNFTEYWPAIGILAVALSGLYFGIKIGYKWGRKDGESWIKRIAHSAIQIRLGYPMSSGLDDKYPNRIQGVLEVSPPTPEDTKNGFPFQFKFIPDKKQWQSGPCCSAHKKPE